MRLRSCVLAALVLAAAPVRAAVLTDGPLVGAVDHQGAKFFARTDVAGDVSIRYQADSGPCAGTIVTAVDTTKAVNDFATIIAVTGLCSATHYTYNILVNGVAQLPSPEPSFTTFPAAGTSVPFKFAVFADLLGSDHEAPRPAPSYAAAKNDDPAFVIQIGDLDHRDPQGLDEARLMHRDVRGGFTNPSGTDFRNNLAWYFPLFRMWDDHDFGKDNADGRFAGKISARRAFTDYWPLPDLPNSANGLWHTFRYGQAEFFMMDLRYQRDPDADPDGPDHSMLDGENIPNGQKDWLKNALLTSTARWKFMISTVPFNKNSGKRDDSWMGFMTERNEIVDFIKSNNISGVFFISGDVHSGGMIDDGANSDFPEISTPHTNLNRPGPGPCTGVGCRDFWDIGTISGADCDGGYAFVTVGTNPDTVTLEAKDVNGVSLIRYEEDCASRPSEVLSEDFNNTKTRLAWDVPADPGGLLTHVLYDVIRSGSSHDFGASATCTKTNGVETFSFDYDVPAPGGIFYYQVRAENACGHGSMGSASDGTPRAGRNCS